MMQFTGGPSAWSLIWIVFVVVPAVRWSVGWSVSRRRWWRADGWDWDDGRRGRRAREITELRAELESRTAELESLHQRVAELENRVDFAERLMAQPKTAALEASLGNQPLAERSDSRYR